MGQLYEAAGSPSVTLDGPPFADSFGIEWFLPALAWAKEAEIARGTAAGAFSAARPLTWQEAAVFLSRAVDSLKIQTPDPVENRRGPVPAALTEGANAQAAAQSWDWGLLPEKADFTKAPTRAQGLEMAATLADLMK